MIEIKSGLKFMVNSETKNTQVFVLTEGSFQEKVEKGDKEESGETIKYGNQVTDGISKATGIYSSFMNNYLTLTNLEKMTMINSDESNTFFSLILSPDVMAAVNVGTIETDSGAKSAGGILKSGTARFE